LKRYMLDTNTVSHLFRRHPGVAKRVQTAPVASLCISAITEGELRFGLAKRLEAKGLHLAVAEFLRHVDVLAWDSAIAQRYGTMRAALERQGKPLAPIDLLIAAHAQGANSVLVTNDSAFRQVSGLKTEDWTI